VPLRSYHLSPVAMRIKFLLSDSTKPIRFGYNTIVNSPCMPLSDLSRLLLDNCQGAADKAVTKRKPSFKAVIQVIMCLFYKLLVHEFPRLIMIDICWTYVCKC